MCVCGGVHLCSNKSANSFHQPPGRVASDVCILSACAAAPQQSYDLEAFTSKKVFLICRCKYVQRQTPKALALASRCQDPSPGSKCNALCCVVQCFVTSSNNNDKHTECNVEQKWATVLTLIFFFMSSLRRIVILFCQCQQIPVKRPQTFEWTQYQQCRFY